MKSGVVVRVRLRAYACGWTLWIFLGVLGGWAGGFPTHTRELVLPLYDKQTSHLIAVLTAGNVYKDSRSVGFFKVRMLPKAVAEDVELKFESPAFNADFTKIFSSLLDGKSGRNKWEIRRFKVSFRGQTTPVLQSAMVRPAPPDSAAAMVLENVILQEGTFSASLPVAQLVFPENQFPVLLWTASGTNGHWRLLSSFACSETQTSNSSHP
jgi:hypothetical protein